MPSRKEGYAINLINITTPQQQPTKNIFCFVWLSTASILLFLILSTRLPVTCKGVISFACVVIDTTVKNNQMTQR